MPTAPPTRLAWTLRDLRGRAGFTAVAAARATGMSQPKISRIETGLQVPSDDEIRQLCEAYNALPADAEELVGYAREIREGSRRSTIQLDPSSYKLQQRIKKMEARATLVRGFQPALVVGLLQTESYARCVAATDFTGEDLDRQVAARLARQPVLDDEAKQFTLIHTEGALRWQAGGPAVMAEQVDAIIAASRRPNVRVGIIPWTTQVAVFPNHGFHIFDSAFTMLGTQVSAMTFHQAPDVALYEDLFGELEAAASFGEDARRELARIAGEYRLLG